MLDLTIIVVNYRTGGLVVDCLASIIADTTVPAGERVMVVDAMSEDGSSELIASAITANGWGDRVGFLDLQKNGGFAYGNNQAIAAADARWGKAEAYLLLNPDTVVRPGATRALLDFFASHPLAGIAGSSLEDFDGTGQACSFRFPSPLSEFVSEARFGPLTRLLAPWWIVLTLGQSPSRADWVSGASLLVRRQVFEQIGMLDEDYFLYYEETDFCRRAADAGWECWSVPQSRVVHLCGQSTGVSARDSQPRRRPAYWFNSRNRYFDKHLGHWGRLAADLGWISGQAVFRLRQLLQRRPNAEPPFLVRDFLANRSPRSSK